MNFSSLSEHLRSRGAFLSRSEDVATEELFRQTLNVLHSSSTGSDVVIRMAQEEEEIISKQLRVFM